jgi:hypothetical protein
LQVLLKELYHQIAEDFHSQGQNLKGEAASIIIHHESREAVCLRIDEASRIAVQNKGFTVFEGPFQLPAPKGAVYDPVITGDQTKSDSGAGIVESLSQKFAPSVKEGNDLAGPFMGRGDQVISKDPRVT